MAWKYKRCTPDDCCKDEAYGKPGDKPEDKGKKITAASSTKCDNSTAKGTGDKCKCAFVKHYTEYVRDGSTDGWRRDTGLVVVEEKIHGYSDSSGWSASYDKWSDHDEEEFKKELKKWKEDHDRDSDIRLLLLCIEIDGDGTPVTLPKPE